MSAIVDFFASIVDILVSLVTLVVTTIKSILWLVVNLPQLVAGVTTGFAYVPDFIMPFLLCSLSLLLIIALIRML